MGEVVTKPLGIVLPELLKWTTETHADSLGVRGGGCDKIIQMLCLIFFLITIWIRMNELLICSLTKYNCVFALNLNMLKWSYVLIILIRGEINVPKRLRIVIVQYCILLFFGNVIWRQENRCSIFIHQLLLLSLPWMLYVEMSSVMIRFGNQLWKFLESNIRFIGTAYCPHVWYSDIVFDIYIQNNITDGS